MWAAVLFAATVGGPRCENFMKREFLIIGIDLSPAMLAQTKKLNPDCTFIQGDMRTYRLDRTFDAILMDDAISDMNCRKDFEAAFRTAYEHLNPGGVLVVTPDVTFETFQQNRTTTTLSGRKGVEVVFVENIYDPDPEDDHYETTILYLIRDDRCLRIETDHWTLGIFSLDTWRNVLRYTGLDLREGRNSLDEDEYRMFACVKTG